MCFLDVTEYFKYMVDFKGSSGQCRGVSGIVWDGKKRGNKYCGENWARFSGSCAAAPCVLKQVYYMKSDTAQEFQGYVYKKVTKRVQTYVKTTVLFNNKKNFNF